LAPGRAEAEDPETQKESGKLEKMRELRREKKGSLSEEKKKGRTGRKLCGRRDKEGKHKKRIS